MLLAGCVTSDLNTIEESPEAAPSVLSAETQVIERTIARYEADARVIEKPVIIRVPENADVLSIPDDIPGYSEDHVRRSRAEGLQLPDNHHYAQTLYDYNEGFIYPVICQPLMITDIFLEPGERIEGSPVLGDSTRWIVSSGESHTSTGTVQHIYLKPFREGLETSFIINTNRRTYNFQIFSSTDSYIPMVKFRYQETVYTGQVSPSGYPVTEYVSETDRAPVSLLSFDYRLRRSMFMKAAWIPVNVYDDGQKTYIVMPEETLQSEYPIVTGPKGELLNIRTVENIIIIDRLIEEVQVRIQNKTVRIQKKRRGRNG